MHIIIIRQPDWYGSHSGRWRIVIAYARTHQTVYTHWRGCRNQTKLISGVSYPNPTISSYDREWMCACVCECCTVLLYFPLFYPLLLIIFSQFLDSIWHKMNKKKNNNGSHTTKWVSACVCFVNNEWVVDLKWSNTRSKSTTKSRTQWSKNICHTNNLRWEHDGKSYKKKTIYHKLNHQNDKWSHAWLPLFADLFESIFITELAPGGISIPITEFKRIAIVREQKRQQHKIHFRLLSTERSKQILIDISFCCYFHQKTEATTPTSPASGNNKRSPNIYINCRTKHFAFPIPIHFRMRHYRCC